MRGLASHKSVIVGVTAFGTVPPEQLTVTFVGTFANTGAALSPTEIRCEAVEELPQASLAVQVLMIV
jgi:hypothetical protein